MTIEAKLRKVGEQALYLARLKGLSRKEAQTRLKKWFARFEITDWWNRKVEELSKGMQQKVQFVVTILHEPELLIFDEPFSGFDPINADMLKKEIRALRDELNVLRAGALSSSTSAASGRTQQTSAEPSPQAVSVEEAA